MSERHTVYVFPQFESELLRKGFAVVAKAAVPSPGMTKIELTEEELDGLLLRSLREIAACGHQMSPHKEGNA